MPWEDECQARGQHPGCEGREGGLVCEVGPTPPAMSTGPQRTGPAVGRSDSVLGDQFVLSSVLDNFVWLP